MRASLTSISKEKEVAPRETRDSKNIQNVHTINNKQQVTSNKYPISKAYIRTRTIVITVLKPKL
jgi:hypothetical protein